MERAIGHMEGHRNQVETESGKRKSKSKWVPYGKYAVDQGGHSRNYRGWGWKNGYQGWQGPGGWGPGWWDSQPWWAGSVPGQPWLNKNWGWGGGRSASSASWSLRMRAFLEALYTEKRDKIGVEAMQIVDFHSFIQKINF